MPILESQLNGRIATLLGRMAPRWVVRGENRGAFQGSQRQPDILVTQTGAQPVVIENEYAPANTVEVEARERLGESLDAGVVQASGRVNAAVALRSPVELHECAGLDEVDGMLREGVALEYALFTLTGVGIHSDHPHPSPLPQGRGGLSILRQAQDERFTGLPTPVSPQGRGGRVDYARFPKSGFIRGSIRDLAAFVEYAATPEDAVQRAVTILEEGVQDAAAILRQAAELSDDTQAAIIEHLKQPYSEQTLRMAATILVNALVFHQNLAGQHGVRNLDQIASDGVLTQASVLEEWRKILGVNYWSIFNIASDLLRSVNPPGMAVDALRVMRRTADRLIALGVSQSHDLSGTVFQRLIADRKFLATFYTRPESAALLAHLAIPDDGGWGDADRVKDFRIADYACGTGTLIHAAYRRLNQLHWLAGGEPERLHAHMMENALTACDVLPSSVHLTASMLSSSHPRQRYDGSRTVVMQYGKTEQGGVSIGSLDLLGDTGAVRPLIPLHTATAVTGTGEARADLDVDMPPLSQNLVIMNPPFTRAGSDWEGDSRTSDSIKPFQGLSNDLETQTRMAEIEKEYTKGTCYHGYAGIASAFVAVANRMVRKGGTTALVLPMTVLQGVSWRKVRQLIARRYRNVTILTIAGPRQYDRSFSADTGMAETMIVSRESSDTPSGRGLFVSLLRRPDSEMEATEIARVIREAVEDSTARKLEDGPFGGSPVLVGDERLGEMIDAPLSMDAPWSAVGIADFAVAQTALQIAQGNVWLPQMQELDALRVPMNTLQYVCQIGIYDMNIVGGGKQAAFNRIKPPSFAPTYPMLWNHDVQLETRMVVAADSEGRVKPGREQRASEIWDTRSHAHHNRDFQFNAQPLAAAFTESPTIGGRAWPNVKFDERAHEVVYTLWGNTTLGLLCYWWHSGRQQAGRGSIPVTAMRSMPTLDVTRLTRAQLDTAESIFEDMREAQFLPANEAYRDNTRKELDHRVLIDVLGLPTSVLEPLDLLRLKWCSEPSVHGGKRTGPGG